MYCPFPRIPHNERVFECLEVHVGFVAKEDLSRPLQEVPDSSELSVDLTDMSRQQVITKSGPISLGKFEVYNLPEEHDYLPDFSLSKQ